MPVKRDVEDDKLLDQFMQRVSELPNLWVESTNADPDALLPGMNGGVDDSVWAQPLWRPWRTPADFRPIDPAYAASRVRFPPLYERMATRYRWLEFPVPGLAVLYENGSEVPLETVLRRIASLNGFSRRLLSRGMLPFGNEEGGSFDPICFDCRRRRRDGDCPVLRIDHEAVILQDDDRPWETWPVAESFRDFLEMAMGRLGRRS